MWLEILKAGIDALFEYLSLHVLTCLVPSFFIAGAISALVSQPTILKYFGVDTKKWVSYTIASISGTILSVCSCTILPMFAGIYKRGAGIGPATAFLFSGPAINILALALTTRILGFNLGAARTIGAVLMAVSIGLIMALIFERGNENGNKKSVNDKNVLNVVSNTRSVTFLFFALLIAILLVSTVGILSEIVKLAVISALILGVVIILIFRYSKEDVRRWGSETWWLTRKIVPILLLGVFVVGLIGGIGAIFAPSHDPQSAVGELMKPYLGDNSLLSCFLASVIGGMLYMPTLLEVPIVGNLFGYTTGQMSPGAALSLLLAGPSLSLPSIIVIWRTIGTRKMSVYVVLVILFSTAAGTIYGTFFG